MKITGGAGRDLKSELVRDALCVLSAVVFPRAPMPVRYLESGGLRKPSGSDAEADRLPQPRPRLATGRRRPGPGAGRVDGMRARRLPTIAPRPPRSCEAAARARAGAGSAARTDPRSSAPA